MRGITISTAFQIPKRCITQLSREGRHFSQAFFTFIRGTAISTAISEEEKQHCLSRESLTKIIMANLCVCRFTSCLAGRHLLVSSKMITRPVPPPRPPVCVQRVTKVEACVHAAQHNGVGVTGDFPHPLLALPPPLPRPAVEFVRLPFCAGAHVLTLPLKLIAESLPPRPHPPRRCPCT